MSLDNYINDINQIIEIQTECELSIWTFADYQSELEQHNSLILTAKKSQKSVGFLASRFLMKSQYEFDVENDTTTVYSEAEILNFGVLKSYQSQGIGNLLFSELLQTVYSLSIKTIWLDVRISNLRAIKFYSSRGFVKVERRKNFYTFPAEDAIVMKLDTRVPYGLRIETKLDSARDFEITSLRNPK